MDRIVDWYVVVEEDEDLVLGLALEELEKPVMVRPD